MRSVNHHRVLAIHLRDNSTLLISKPVTPTENLVRQLDIMSLVIGQFASDRRRCKCSGNPDTPSHTIASRGR